MENLNLNYEGFEQYLVETNSLFDGIQYVFKFENNYGASVVKHGGSYGHSQDLWELAVLMYDDLNNRELCYDTPITEDVEGYLTDENVRDLLAKIKEL